MKDSEPHLESPSNRRQRWSRQILGLFITVAREIDRILRQGPRGLADSFVLIGTITLFVSVAFLAERLGSDLDLDIDLGFVLVFVIALLYLTYRLWDGLNGDHAWWYEKGIEATIGVVLAIVLGRIAFVNGTVTSVIGVLIFWVAFMGFAFLFDRLVGSRDRFYHAAVVTCGFFCAVLFAWICSSAWTIMLWRVIERPSLVKTPASTGPVIAITLSGGGYRAALTHAGVLWALEEAGLAPKILSTVSGGSIIGAAYSIGWSPLQFRDHLMRRKPYLSSDLLNILPVAALFASPRVTTGDTLAFHLAQRYFGFATMETTAPRILLINATRYVDGSRHVFGPPHKGTAWAFPLPIPGVSDDRHLARLVAASGAFPGAFAPVRIGSDYYLDGGVRENLGIEGLYRFLDDSPSERENVRIVIVSDIGADTQQKTVTRQPTSVDGAVQAFELLYGEAEPTIRRRFLQKDVPDGDDLHWKLVGFRSPSTSIPVIYLKPRSTYGRSRFPDPKDRALMESVTSLPALHELSKHQVAVAFWVGAQLAAGVIPELCARLKISSCPVPNVDTVKP